MTTSLVSVLVYVLIYIPVMARVLMVENKEPASRAAWIMILLFLPIVGVIAYLFLGETWISRNLRRQAEAVDQRLVGKAYARGETRRDCVPAQYHAAFQACAYAAGDIVSGGNHADLAQDANDAIDMMVQDFDNAQQTIHISFYIWLTDHNGRRVIEALKRASRRGVICRVIVDGIGSRGLIRSHFWHDMRNAGVLTCISMKVSRGLELLYGTRMDLRNHRKIVVVDNSITYCGSQNCADPEFRIKAKYGPWVDIMLRFTGPVVRQQQKLFAGDWMVEKEEDISSLITQAEPEATQRGFPAIAFGTGPISPQGAMTNIFVNLLGSASRELIISNPYFVPDPALLNALLFCARRGVKTTLMLPARNDSRIVGLISKSYYPHLIEAGVEVFEFQAGLLHAKTLVVDEQVALIGSANMDRRSLDLNFENNILLYSDAVAGRIKQRQHAWLAQSRRIRANDVANRPRLRQIAKNLATIFAPIM